MLVVIRGAGDLATGIALRLHRAGYQIVMTDLPAPTSIRRTVCFSEAIRLGEMTVEDISARKAETPEEALTLAQSGVVAVLADPAGACIPTLRPGAVVDAILAKKNLGTALTDAPVVIGVGPGFTVGTDCPRRRRDHAGPHAGPGAVHRQSSAQHRHPRPHRRTQRRAGPPGPGGRHF